MTTNDLEVLREKLHTLAVEAFIAGDKAEAAHETWRANPTRANRVAASVAGQVHIGAVGRYNAFLASVRAA